MADNFQSRRNANNKCKRPRANPTAARVGIWYLMITFGAAFGFTVMGRIALLAARVEFLFDDWLWLIDPNHLRGL